MTEPDAAVAALVAAITPAVVEQYPQLDSTDIIAADLVTSVLSLSAAAKDVVGGAAIDTIRRNSNGDLATRVLRGGVPMWEFRDANGAPLHYTTEPDLDWPDIYTPTEQ